MRKQAFLADLSMDLRCVRLRNEQVDAIVYAESGYDVGKILRFGCMNLQA